MKNTYIKNDFGELRYQYWLKCNKITKQPYPPEEYKWPWLCFDSILQHAPERKYIRGKTEITLSNINDV